jgi:hypothetical protein
MGEMETHFHEPFSHSICFISPFANFLLSLDSLQAQSMGLHEYEALPFSYSRKRVLYAAKAPLSHRTPYPRRSWAVARRRPPINSHIKRTNIERFFIPRIVCFYVYGGISEMDTWSWILGVVLHLRLRRN